jgi:hypothetical protein
MALQPSNNAPPLLPNRCRPRAEPPCAPVGVSGGPAGRDVSCSPQTPGPAAAVFDVALPGAAPSSACDRLNPPSDASPHGLVALRPLPASARPIEHGAAAAGHPGHRDLRQSGSKSARRLHLSRAALSSARSPRSPHVRAHAWDGHSRHQMRADRGSGCPARHTLVGRPMGSRRRIALRHQKWQARSSGNGPAMVPAAARTLSVRWGANRPE